MDCLGGILEKHLPHPQNGASSYKKKKVSGVCLLPVVCHRQCSVNVFCFQNASTEPEEDLLSLSEILEVGPTV